MTKVIRLAPPNSLLFISDLDGGTTPAITSENSIWSTPSCIAVGCLAFMDGETEVRLGAASDVDPGRTPDYEQILETPKYCLMISTAEGEVLLITQVPARETVVSLWVNRPKEPDQVSIGYY